MTALRILAVVYCIVPFVAALTTQSTSQQPPRSRQQTQHQFRSSSKLSSSEQDEFDCDPCAKFLHEDGEDIELDRREAFFSMLGMAWAVGGLPASLMTTMQPEPAHAIYGTDAKIELPNPIQSMSDRATKQCLVESLGTRECLVYADPNNKLYQGADGKLLLDRVDAASKSLGLLPSLIESKKWSQVTGVLTGPMGELIRTMNQLVELSENQTAAKKIVAQVKTDLYAISAAVGRKEVASALKSHQAATDHLVAFVKAL
eukprot:scaffold17767_cov168-Amphora_coffeaeformis.AAC.1